MNQLDLFAGIGGLSLAAEWAGINTVAFCEKEPFAQKVLRHRFPGHPIYDDVFNLTREVLERDGIINGEKGIDIIAGGFPCQPFSHAGKRTGTADDRYLWPEMYRIIGEVRPTWVLAENVDGLVNMAQSDWDFIMEDEATICQETEMVVETIRKDLETIRYQSIPIIIPACSVGASHRRYRVLILGYTSDPGLPIRGRSCGAESGTEKEAGMDSKFERSSEALADTKGKRCNEARGDCQRSKKRSSGSSEILAHTQSWRWESRWAEQQGQQGELCSVGSSTSRENVADTSSARCEECDASAVTSETGYGSGSTNPLRANGAAQPGMGGGPYELSDWLDGFGMNPLDSLINFIASYPQPALIGQPQHDWEPPRVATGVKGRVGRLKGLGNAVDPLQALPVFYAMRLIHDYLGIRVNSSGGI